ncbi:MAG: tetratricopeptide repeat protein [Deltaproteobacteria bacterium]|nr:tetratricopeptide repeat protein [Deltaproteobacteria bacterium]
MAGMFFIMSIFFYVQGRESSQSITKFFNFLLCIICGLFSFGSKENTAMLPFCIILLDLFLIQGLTKKNITRTLLLILLFAFLPAVLLILTKGFSSLDPAVILGGYSQRNFSVVSRLLTESRVIIFYISLLIYPMPFRLCVVHEPTISLGLFDPPTTVLSIVVIIIIIAVAFAISRKHPLISYCILFFFINHIIESSIFPLELVFEHRNYLPSMLFFIPISILILKAIQLFLNKPLMKAIISGFVVLFIISYGHGTFIRNAIWKTDESLWLDAAEKYPLLPRPYHNLGYYYERVGQYEKAIKYYKYALTLPQTSYGNKDYFTYSNLALLYEKMGQRAEAEKQLRKSIAMAPGLFLPAYNNLGVILLHEKRYKEALKIFAKALEYAPDNWKLHHNLGILLLRTGQPKEAIIEFRRASELNGNSYISLEYLGISFKKTGNFGKAFYYLQKAISKNPKSILTRLHLAEIYIIRGNKKAAENIVIDGLSSLPPRLVFSELKAYTRGVILRELPDKSRIMPLLENYYSKMIENVR